ncbi:hypothetical protein MPSEU_000840100 [Mayamaea pseudoterrestris]|nr:hypothetical protein MPSEU_000840100 [Mayamaea pseudoterrestris]
MTTTTTDSQLKQPRRRLWIGGTSGLARTYFNAFPDEAWLVTGRKKPSWLPTQHVFCPVDFTNHSDSSPIYDELMNVDDDSTIDEIIIGIRPPLACFKSFAEASREYTLLAQGMERFLTRILAVHTKVSTVIHISSVAAVDHSTEQVEWNESNVSNASLIYPYDIFKRDCELMTERLAKQHEISRWTNLRISAIFSDAPNCIQCGALQLQSMLVSCAMMQKIDCNSARNVASCLHAMLQNDDNHSAQALAPVYYYTRCTDQPVPYVSHLLDYQFVYNSLDYLLIVASQSHSFDNGLVHSQFDFVEESIVECFIRRRLLHRKSDKA